MSRAFYCFFSIAIRIVIIPYLEPMRGVTFTLANKIKCQFFADLLDTLLFLNVNCLLINLRFG